MIAPNINSKSKRIAKNTLFLYFRQFLTMAVAIYTSRIVLQALGVVDYGVYNVVGGMVAMFSFLNSSLAQATQRFIAFGIEKDDIEKQKDTLSMLLNVHVLIAILLFILCETIGLWLFYNKLVIPVDRVDSAFWVMQCSILTLMVSVTQVPYNASIFGHERMNAYAYISILEVLLKLGIVILLQYYFTDKLLAYGIMLMCVQISIAMIYRLYCLHQFKNCNYRFYWSNQLFKQLFSFSSWSLIGNFAFTMNGQGMNFLINIFFGPVYNAAKGIASAVESAVTSFVTNLDKQYTVFTAPDLNLLIKAALKKNLAKKPVFLYPDEICTAGMLDVLSNRGINFFIPKKECLSIYKLDTQKKCHIYGKGLLLSPRLAAEKAEKVIATKVECFDKFLVTVFVSRQISVTSAAAICFFSK